jgi:ankyrin repeat protein
MDLEGAAGAGRLDVVRSFFREDGTLNPTATREQMKDGFAWACEFGRTDVAGFLLDHGMDLHARLRHHGQTGLHWAAYGGHAATVRLLLDRGAAVNATDAHHEDTPLEWALYEWGTGGAKAEKASYYDVVRVLVRAGAGLSAEWRQRNRQVWERAEADPVMAAALRAD